MTNKTTKKTRGWTEERRQRQRERILKSRPWEKSTGPKTPTGKMISSMNGLKHGNRSALITEARRILNLNKQFIDSYAKLVLFDSVRMQYASELLKKSKAHSTNILNELKKSETQFAKNPNSATELKESQKQWQKSNPSL